MFKKGFSIDLGPELDSRWDAEWGWIEDEDPEAALPLEVRIKRDRTTGHKLEKKLAPQRAKPKYIPPRPLPALAEVTMEPEPEPTELDIFAQELSLDAAQNLAEAAALRLDS